MTTPIFPLQGLTLTSTGTAVGGVIPFDGDMRKMPLHISVNATGNGAYVRLSNDQSAASATDILVQAGDSVLLSVLGRRFISAVSVSGTSVISISALSTGISGDAASLSLDFTSNEPFDSRITFTRATAGRRTNRNGVIESVAANVPRIDFNPITKACNGLLIEEQRTNLLLRSAEFDNASWIKTRSSITANTIVAPDGTLAGEKLVEDTTATSSHVITQSIAGNARNVAYAYSVFAKAGERTRFRLSCNAYSGSAILADFDLSTGSVVQALNAGTGSGAAGSIVNVGNGWYRCTLTGTPSTSTSTGMDLDLFLISGGTVTYTGDGYSGIYIWGAQLEAGAFPTSYIATVAAQVTRSADLASMTGTNFSSWYTADQGTLYVESQSPAAAQAIFTVSDNTNNNRILFQQGTNTRSTVITTGGVAQTNPGSVSATYGQFAKSALGIATNSARVAVGGVLGTESTSVTMPVVDRMYIGINQTGSANWLNGTIRKLAFYPIRLSNTQLQALTS